MQEALVKENAIVDEMQGKFLTFQIADGEYGIEISYVTEIIGVQDITSVPNTDQYVKGIINLRGTIVPVIDMRLRFSLQPMEYTDRTCTVVLAMEDMCIGLIVDEVQEVLTIADEFVQPPPKSNSRGVKNDFIKAIGSSGTEVKQLLDINKIFEIEEEAI